jgi:RNA polymerase sigma-70 factor (ECF subfamily)
MAAISTQELLAAPRLNWRTGVITLLPRFLWVIIQGRAGCVTMVVAKSDVELLQEVQRRIGGALEELYDRYATFAFRLALRILADRGQAEDVVQEVFFGLWSQAATFDEAKGSVRNWILSSTHHRAIDFVRRRKGKASKDVELADLEYRLSSPDPWDEVARNADGGLLRSAMESLPDDQRRTLAMAYFEGMTHSEIAGAMGVPLGTVKGRLRLALEKMRTYLVAQGIRTAD